MWIIKIKNCGAQVENPYLSVFWTDNLAQRVATSHGWIGINLPTNQTFDSGLPGYNCAFTATDASLWLWLWRFNLPTQCFLLTACVTLFSLCSAVGPISSSSSSSRICGQQRPAAGGPLHGLAHGQSVGGCCVGRVEHRGLHLWLHPHQRHGAAHPRPGKRHHHPPVCHRAALRGHIGTFQLHPLQEALTVPVGGSGLGPTWEDPEDLTCD